MIRPMINLVLRVLAVLLIGLAFAVMGFLVGSIIFTTFFPEVVVNGREGYEAGGPIGFIFGALMGLPASSVLLFRKRISK